MRNLHLVECLSHTRLQRLASFLQWHARQRSLDEVLESADVQPALDRHLHSLNVLPHDGHPVCFQKLAVLVHRKLLARLHLLRPAWPQTILAPQRADRLEHPLAVVRLTLRRMATLVERCVEGKLATRIQRPCDVVEQRVLVRDVVDGVAEHHRIHRFLQRIGQPLDLAVYELNGGIAPVLQVVHRLLQRTRRMVNRDDHGLAGIVETLHNQARNATRAARKINNPPVHAEVSHIHELSIQPFIKGVLRKLGERIIVGCHGTPPGSGALLGNAIITEKRSKRN